LVLIFFRESFSGHAFLTLSGIHERCLKRERCIPLLERIALTKVIERGRTTSTGLGWNDLGGVSGASFASPNMQAALASPNPYPPGR
jgi:hypothetical protein